MLIYLITVSVFLFALATIWKRESWPNVLIKLIMFGFAFWGMFYAMKVAGYLIRI